MENGRLGSIPTNIASMHLMMGCLYARAGVKIVKEKELLEQPNATMFCPPSLITTSGVAIGVALVITILVGRQVASPIIQDI